MNFVVTVLSWAGWAWTTVFFAVVIPLLAIRARRDQAAFAAGDVGQETSNA